MNPSLFFPLFLYFICHGAQGQPSTSLYIPGLDPQPVSADIIGVGSDGRTTWALHKGTPDPSDTSSYPDFMGTATLIEGPNDAFLTYGNSAAQFTIAGDCTFSASTIAICTIVAQSSTATQTQYISRLPIQGGSTILSSRNPNPTVTPTSKSSSADHRDSTSPSPSPSGASSTNSNANSASSNTSYRSALTAILSLIALVAYVAAFSVF